MEVETEVETVRIALIDAHPVIRAGLRSVVTQDSELTLVVESESLVDSLDELKAQDVEVVILGVREPVSEAIRDLEELVEHCPRVAPVVFTSLQSAPSLMQLMLAGARAYLLTDYGHEEIVDAVRTARRGKTMKVPMELAIGMFRRMPGSGGVNDSQGSVRTSFARLTTREREVLNCMAKGELYRTIAERLFLAESTVKKYAHSVITKLGASNRAAAVLNAYHLNLLNEPDAHSLRADSPELTG